MLCDDDEECFDDNAFGRCQFPYDLNVDTYRHLLGSETTKLLERELTRLFAGGYRWRHKYTQCVIQNILYTSRHGISYDPGLCSRVMQFTLPDVPPDVFSDLQSTDPDELAYIKFKPNRDDPGSTMFADEIFNPPVRDMENYEVKETRKRSPVSNDDKYTRNNWVEDLFETDDYEKKQYPEITNKENLFAKLLEAADETGKLFEQFQNKADRYPDEDVPIVRTELSSDLNQRPAFSEGGIEWIPTEEDELFLRENDIIDPYEKKRIARPNEVVGSNDIPVSGREYDDDDNDVDDFFANGNDIQVISEEPTYESQPQGENEDDDNNFKWNYKHINKGIDDLTKFSRRYKNTNNRNLDSDEDKNLKDVIEDDYLEDQFYAILPVDSSMSTFTRNMRYDTKKPGPTYMIHEDEDGETSEMAAEEGSALISRLSKATQEDQLLALLKTPVRTAKTSTVVVPRRETIETKIIDNEL